MPDAATESATSGQQGVALSFITEEAIRRHLLEAVSGTRNGDSVNIATFYLADRKVLDALLDAAARGARVRVILDPNRDAFGREKDGVPNRPVANELVTQSGERIEVRWYRTHGEQFHSKIAMVRRGDRFIASLGSANLTRRNVGNYNLEANIAVEAGVESPLALEMMGYFDRMWNNDGPPGTEYTAAFGAYRDQDNGTDDQLTEGHAHEQVVRRVELLRVGGRRRAGLGHGEHTQADHADDEEQERPHARAQGAQLDPLHTRGVPEAVVTGWDAVNVLDGLGRTGHDDLLSWTTSAPNCVP